MPIIKTVEWVLMALYAGFMIRSFLTGRKLAEKARLGLPYGADLFISKVTSARWSYRLLWAVIVWSLFLGSKKQPDHLLLAVHLPFALASLWLATLIKFRKSGNKDPKNHRSYAFGLMFTSSIMLLTGGLMMVEY